MKFYQPDFLEEYGAILDPEQFLLKMKEVGELDAISGNHHIDSYHLCKNACAYVIYMLHEKGDGDSLLFLEEMKVIDGSFNGLSHSWIVLGDYYIDLTLSQFVVDAPKLSITKKSEVEAISLYQSYKAYDALEWSLLQRGEMPVKAPVMPHFSHKSVTEVVIDGKKILL